MTKQEHDKLSEERGQTEIILEEMLNEQQYSFSILGQEYYKKVCEDPDILISNLSDYVDTVKVSELEIAKLEEDIKGMNRLLKEPLDLVCSKCGRIMDPNAKYCSECGAQLEKEEQDINCPNSHILE
ncbi:zinc ribbon domain-containing protein [Blautia liquoris]|jgi:DNA-directed RNA polymerase subunit RPC12/RpoP|uniref:Zinc ribbon domain-containing protein n=1 Tax=Blautia liquoris TaxID=2779518 RepID=A0A7M2RHE9_9FIRM|nr:zinc ribbon domain-containing protein [Blautia liquoris]QOV19424.1 zinc ribbon domain-containing protein [Blautia liquoris]